MAGIDLGSANNSRQWRPLVADKAPWEHNPPPAFGAQAPNAAPRPSFDSHIDEAKLKEQSDLALKLFRDGRQELQFRLDGEPQIYQGFPASLQALRIPQEPSTKLMSVRAMLRDAFTERPLVVAVNNRFDLGPCLVAPSSYSTADQSVDVLRAREPNKVPVRVKWNDCLRLPSQTKLMHRTVEC